jgi:RNA polymerase sigma factor (sigma-70 family)
VSAPPLTDAEKTMVEKNLGLVWYFVNRLPERNEDERNERFADGVFGLMRAVQLFDPKRGYTFSTYAAAWIRSRIDRGRHVRAGGNARRSVKYGERYIEVSIDRPLYEPTEEGEGDALGEALVGSADVENEAIAMSDLVAAARREIASGADPIDRDLLGRLLSGEFEHRQLQDVLDEIAETHGRTRRGVHYRREQMNKRLREAMA